MVQEREFNDTFLNLSLGKNFIDPFYRETFNKEKLMNYDRLFLKRERLPRKLKKKIDKKDRKNFIETRLELKLNKQYNLCQ